MYNKSSWIVDTSVVQDNKFSSNYGQDSDEYNLQSRRVMRPISGPH